ncbi:hypothetical protein [Metallibacterium sp.]|uniref:hypothetical protein n=1 Tax=Metallibacterium sp. TaxID=2940281 RepID=UPI002629A0FA|nr:hypothetical protein [Metallibacterium sp.]
MSRKVAHNALWNVGGQLVSLGVGLAAASCFNDSTPRQAEYHASANTHVSAATGILKSTPHEP